MSTMWGKSFYDWKEQGVGMKVAVFGDRMVDRYWLGEASGLSAEVPIPVVKIKDSIVCPGGAGNVVANLVALGVEVVDTTHRWANSGYDYYPVKNRLMVGDHQIARWDLQDKCEPWDHNVLPKVDAVVVADYGKGAITKEIVEKIKLLDAPVFVDTKNDPSVWSGAATAVFPNWKEYLQFAKEYDNFDGIVVTKKGADGLHLYSKPLGYGCVSPAQARFIRSVNGAGDTVIAAFVYKYLWILKDAKFTGKFTNDIWALILRFANTAASIAVENPFTYAPRLEQVQERYYEGS